MIKSEKAITLIALVITIIVLLILVSTTVYVGVDTHNEYLATDFTYKMQLLQKKIDNLVADGKTDVGHSIDESGKSKEITTAIEQAEIANEISVWNTTIQNIKYFSTDDIKSALDVEEIDFDIVVNFDTREIICVDGFKYSGNMYYTQYNLEQGQKLITYDYNLIQNERIIDMSFGELFTTREAVIADNISIDAAEGLNCIIVIPNVNLNNGTLKYKIENGNWITISNRTSKENDYAVKVSKSGKYIFNLTDNTNSEMYSDEIQVEIVNQPREDTTLGITEWNINYDYSDLTNSTKFAYATVEEKTYLWVPRFAIKNNTIKFAQGITSIATDETFLDSTWSVPNNFKTDIQEYTGIWVEVTSTEGNNLLTIFN